jgi:hypothetical protein
MVNGIRQAKLEAYSVLDWLLNLALENENIMCYFFFFFCRLEKIYSKSKQHASGY